MTTPTPRRDVDEMAASLSRDGFGDDEIGAMLGRPCTAGLQQRIEAALEAARLEWLRPGSTAGERPLTGHLATALLPVVAGELCAAADDIDRETQALKDDGVLEPHQFRPCRDATAALRARAAAITARASTLREAGWVPCSPDWLAANPTGCATAPRVPGDADTSHWHPARAALPRRGDAFEAWLKAQRDQYRDSVGPTCGWRHLDAALDDYRLHADTGTPLTERACDGPHCDHADNPDARAAAIHPQDGGQA